MIANKQIISIHNLAMQPTTHLITTKFHVYTIQFGITDVMIACNVRNETASRLNRAFLKIN